MNLVKKSLMEKGIRDRIGVFGEVEALVGTLLLLTLNSDWTLAGKLILFSSKIS